MAIEATCQFCGGKYPYPGQIFQETAKEVTDKKRAWYEEIEVMRCNRCKEAGRRLYIDRFGGNWEILEPKAISRSAVLAQTMDTIFDEHGVWALVDAEDEGC